MNGIVEYSEQSHGGIENCETNRSCIYVTTLLSPVSCLAQYSTQPEVKFDAFYMPQMRGRNIDTEVFVVIFIWGLRTALTFRTR